MSYEITKKHKSFEGEVLFCSHESNATGTEMNFSAYIPNNKKKATKAIIWLSGLTCNEENFITKAHAQAWIKNSDTMIICPDTSPRNQNISGQSDSYDFGEAASFYINATKGDYAKSYQMEDYILKDICGLLKDEFGVSKISIFGHSMGGHGALTLGLKAPNQFESISAFSPIVNPINCQWGQKAFSGYLGDDKTQWKEHDACELISSGATHKRAIKIDQGLDDNFYPDQLLTKNFEEICGAHNQDLELAMHEGYDHSYYFISTFMQNHINFHLKALND